MAGTDVDAPEEGREWHALARGADQAKAMDCRPGTAQARFNDIKAEWNAATRCVSPADARLRVPVSAPGRQRTAPALDGDGMQSRAQYSHRLRRPSTAVD